MSLLMDALKKAEAAKRQGVEGVEGVEGASNSSAEPSKLGFGEMSLEPIVEPVLNAEPDSAASVAGAAVRNVPTSLPELPSNLGGLDAEFVAHHEAHKAASASSARLNALPAELSRTPPPASAPVPVSKSPAPVSDSRVQADRDAARNMFDAKAPAQPGGKRKFALVIGILSVSVALAIVGYFWWQYQSNFAVPSSNFAVRPAPALLPATPATPVSTPPGGSAVTAAPTVAGVPGQTNANDLAGVKDSPEDTEMESQAGAPKTAVAPAIASKKKLAVAVETNEDGDAIRLVRVTKSPLQVNPALAKGYEEFNRGNFAAARTSYEALLKLEPHNLDALHGLAAIAVAEKRWSAADHYYERILVADPKDAAALSGLINLHGQNNPAAAESRLKGIASEQPESAAAQFALGNLFASQQRWADAQQAYFKAYSADAENPDILYNLAVSLEHMNQSKLALQYYVLALAAAKRRPAGFDISLVSARAVALRSP